MTRSLYGVGAPPSADRPRAGAFCVAVVALIVLGGCLQAPQGPVAGGADGVPIGYERTNDLLMEFQTDGQEVGSGKWFMIELLSLEPRTVRVGLVLEGDEDAGAGAQAAAPPDPDLCGYYYNSQEGILFWGDHEGSVAQVGHLVLDQRNPKLTTSDSGSAAAHRSRIESIELKADRPASIVVAFGHASEARLGSASVRLLAGAEVQYRVIGSGSLECRSGLADFDDGTTVRVGNRAFAMDLVDDYEVPSTSTLFFVANPSTAWELRRGETVIEQGESHIAFLGLTDGDWRLSVPQVEPSDCRFLWRLILHDYEQPDQLMATPRPECRVGPPSAV